MAGKSKYTEEIAVKIIGYIRAGANRADAALAAGINPDTLYYWMLKHKGFSERVHEADGSAVVIAENAALKRDPVRWLQAKRPKEWGQRVRIDVNQIVAELDETIAALAAGTAGADTPALDSDSGTQTTEPNPNAEP